MIYNNALTPQLAYLHHYKLFPEIIILGNAFFLKTKRCLVLATMLQVFFYIQNFVENSLVRPTLVYINYNLRTFSTLFHYVGYHFGKWSSELVFCTWTIQIEPIVIVFSQIYDFEIFVLAFNGNLDNDFVSQSYHVISNFLATLFVIYYPKWLCKLKSVVFYLLLVKSFSNKYREIYKLRDEKRRQKHKFLEVKWGAVSVKYCPPESNVLSFPAFL